MEAAIKIHLSGSLQKDQDDLEDTIEVREHMKFGKGIDFAKNCVLEHTAPEVKQYFPRKANTGLYRKDQQSPKSNIQKKKET